jgi:hypothetical protein
MGRDGRHNCQNLQALLKVRYSSELSDLLIQVCSIASRGIGDISHRTPIGCIEILTHNFIQRNSGGKIASARLSADRPDYFDRP